MKRIFSIILLTAVLFTESRVCLNGETKVLKDGTFLYINHEGAVPYGHISDGEEGLLIGLRQLDSLYRTTGDLDYLSDKGLVLILLKRYDEAVTLYQKIEQESPNRYSTASNLGTTYELLGQNEKALQWIRKSVRIDPASHYQSEWIHVRILEAKLRGEQAYTTRFLLNTDFGSAPEPETNLERDSLQALSNALYYQLNERISVVQPEDLLVAQLLFDLGNIAFLLRNYEDAVGDYQQAQRYGFNSALFNARMEEVFSRYKRAKRVAPMRSTVRNQGIWILGFCLSAILAVLLFRKRRSRSR